MPSAFSACSAFLRRDLMQDDEILGKAYDARLMRRLLVYLRPYWPQVALAFVVDPDRRRRRRWRSPT